MLTEGFAHSDRTGGVCLLQATSSRSTNQLDDPFNLMQAPNIFTNGHIGERRQASGFFGKFEDGPAETAVTIKQPDKF